MQMSPEHATRSFSVLLTDDETLAREMEEGRKAVGLHGASEVIHPHSRASEGRRICCVALIVALPLRSPSASVMRAVVFEGLNDDPISSSILYIWTTLSLARRRVGFFASLLFATVKQILA